MSLRVVFLLITFILSIGCQKNNDVEVSSDTALKDDILISFDECSGKIGDHPCDFTFKNQNGEDWQLYKNHGNIILLDFSTMWCGYCQISAQKSEDIHTKYKSDNFIWVTILIEDSYGSEPDQADINQWANTFGIEESDVLMGNRSIIDATGESGFPVTAWPTFIIIDESMTIRSGIRGWSEQAIIELIENELYN
jgi:thiol-disulfide isomerase/thioredoxin|tara:strand:- start:151 stop:735 length:585 start_codon:yes stop_codon:yes gene_type:complete